MADRKRRERSGPPNRFQVRPILWLVAIGAGVVGLLSVGSVLLRPAPQPDLSYRTLDYGDLTGWSEASFAETGAFSAWKLSCSVLEQRDGRDEMVSGNPALGRVEDWQAPCRDAVHVDGNDPDAVRRFIESAFVPRLIEEQGAVTGKLTGYFEPELQGSLERTDRFTTPIRGRPADLISADLGAFHPDLEGRRLAGRLDQTRLVPYPDRAAIGEGAIAPDQDRILLWVDDPVAAFFLHIQGSGRVVLTDGSVMRVGYAAQNGHAYTAIGRVLVEQGALRLEEVSMQSIRAWLADHPDRAQAIMDENRSYIFFRPLDLADPSLGPLGSQGVQLTAGHSLAIDPRYHPYGMMLWIDGSAPDPDDKSASMAFRRLMVAQDSGGAIKGVLRGDVFWGAGPVARELAGRMNNPARFVALVPRMLAARDSEGE